MSRDRVQVIDTIPIESRAFTTKVGLLLREGTGLGTSGIEIEIYAVNEDGLEEYAGKLDSHQRAPVAQMTAFLKAIQNRIAQKPLSTISLKWLSALDRGSLLQRWEKHV